MSEIGGIRVVGRGAGNLAFTPPAPPPPPPPPPPVEEWVEAVKYVDGDPIPGGWAIYAWGSPTEPPFPMVEVDETIGATNHDGGYNVIWPPGFGRMKLVVDFAAVTGPLVPADAGDGLLNGGHGAQVYLSGEDWLNGDPTIAFTPMDPTEFPYSYSGATPEYPNFVLDPTPIPTIEVVMGIAPIEGDGGMGWHAYNQVYARAPSGQAAAVDVRFFFAP